MKVDFNLLSFNYQNKTPKKAEKSKVSALNNTSNSIEKLTNSNFYFLGSLGKQSAQRIKNLILKTDMTFDEQDYKELMQKLKKHPFINEESFFIEAYYSIFYCLMLIERFLKEEGKEFKQNDKIYSNGFEMASDIADDNNIPYEYVSLVALDMDGGLDIEEAKRKLKYVVDGTYQKRFDELDEFTFDNDMYDINEVISLNEKEYQRVINALKSNFEIYKQLKDGKLTIKKFDYRYVKGTNDKVLELQITNGNITVTKMLYPDGSVKNKKETINIKSKKQYITTTETNDSGKFLQTLNVDGSLFEFKEDEKGSLSSLVVTKPSKYFEGLYDIVQYDLNNYPYETDIIDEILKGNINDGNCFSYSQKKDSVGIYQENYPCLDYTIKREFEINQKENNYKNIQMFPFAQNSLDKRFNSYDYNISIKDKQGNKLLSVKRSFERITSTKTKTTINDKTYIAYFDDKNKVIKICSNDGTYLVDINQKLDYSTNTKIGNDIIWQHIKNLPADILINLSTYVNKVLFDEDSEGCFFSDNKNMEVIPNITTYAHELGHAIDNSISLSLDKELMAIYKEELSRFENNNTQDIKKYFEYFSLTGGNSMLTSGLSELVAETNALLIFPYNKEESLKLRMQLLIHNFPKTISYIAEKLGYSIN